MTAINDHGLARDTGSHLIGTEWRYPWSTTGWKSRVTHAMYGVLRLECKTKFGNVYSFFSVDELHREMQRVEGGT